MRLSYLYFLWLRPWLPIFLTRWQCKYAEWNALTDRRLWLTRLHNDPKIMNWSRNHNFHENCIQKNKVAKADFFFNLGSMAGEGYSENLHNQIEPYNFLNFCIQSEPNWNWFLLCFWNIVYMIYDFIRIMPIKPLITQVRSNWKV